MTEAANPLYFRHVDGGLYRLHFLARSSADASTVVVYEHIWPFDPGFWVRPQHEFETRFTPIAAEFVAAAMLDDRIAAQEKVNAAKRARRQSIEK